MMVIMMNIKMCVMKKLLVLTMALLVSGVIMAQGDKEEKVAGKGFNHHGGRQDHSMQE